MATLNVLSAGAIRRGVTGVAEMFERASGSVVMMDFTSAPKVQQRVMDGEAVDVVVASASALDALAIEARIAPQSRTLLGRSRMAVVMRKGATPPDLTNMEDFRDAMAHADLLVYNEGSSGAYAATVVDRLGLREQMGGKVRVVPDGAAMMELITSHGGRAYGFAQATSVVDNVEQGVAVALAGFFPDEIQSSTAYEAAVSESSANPRLAASLVDAFGSEAGKALLAASGLD